MRKELQEFDWHVYGLKVSDFDYTLRIINEILADRASQLSQKIDSIKVYDGSGNLIDPSSGLADEAISDLSYYSWVDNLYLWHFTLWRLQGIFEGILKQEFSSDKRLNGLKQKLDYVRKLGYSILDDDYNEIMNWGRLRNALSHFPPEQFRPAYLNEQDIQEYANLVKRVSSDLIEQKGR